MTIEEIKAKHCDKTGYIACFNCPLDEYDSDVCPDSMDGRDDCLEAIINFYKDKEQLSTNSDIINHPKHYTYGGMECIDEMILVFGEEVVMNFCLCNVWKYRKRALHKNCQEDLDKADWYIQKYKELRNNVQYIS